MCCLCLRSLHVDLHTIFFKLTSTWQKKINIPHYFVSHCRFCVVSVSFLHSKRSFTIESAWIKHEHSFGCSFSVFGKCIENVGTRSKLHNHVHHINSWINHGLYLISKWALCCNCSLVWHFSLPLRYRQQTNIHRIKGFWKSQNTEKKVESKWLHSWSRFMVRNSAPTVAH